MVRDEVVAVVAGEPRAVATEGAAARVDVEAAPVVPAVVATAAVVDPLAAVGDATGGTASERSVHHEGK